MVIDWSKFESSGKFVTFEDNKVKQLVLSGWRMASAKFGNDPEKPALKFDVLSEDGVACEPIKELTASNYTLVQGLRPLIEKADQNGRNSIVAAIKKSGQGKGTTYMVLELDPGQVPGFSKN